MAEDQNEITLDVERPEKYLAKTDFVIRRERARTANLVVLVLILAVILSLPLGLIVVIWRPEYIEKCAPIFDKWYAILSPLAGTAVGAYYGSRMHKDHGD